MVVMQSNFLINIFKLQREIFERDFFSNNGIKYLISGFEFVGIISNSL